MAPPVPRRTIAAAATREDPIVATAVDRFVERARTTGIDPDVRTFPDGTRTAADAAAAIGCDVAQIVKSLVFTTADDRQVLVLTSGVNRVDEARVAQHLGTSSVRQATAAEVRTATGYAIGGTPPFGHDGELPVLCDRDLLGHAEVWAAAGSPTTVFPVSPARLIEVTGAALVDVVA
jgi:prolyl-tRNA editing enzyme YbaK/EbsC (Cys-tRNA(Pro) deacylase)